MRTITRFLMVCALSLAICNISCREEEFVFMGDAPEQSLSATSNVANLLIRTSLNDGSEDNILDLASCFSIALPVDVIVNGMPLTIEDTEGLEEIEIIFEESDEDTDTLELVFPITIVFADYTESEVPSQEALNAFAASCPPENSVDDDIECIDIIYPITISIFNPTTENFDSVDIENDQMLNDFLQNLEDEDVVNIEFPILLALTDGTEIEVEDLEGLENTIESFEDACDEDDDNDFNDDNCIDCTAEQLAAAFASCDNFRINQFKLGVDNLITNFITFSFDFQEDGTLLVSSPMEDYTGTWDASGSGLELVLNIEIPGLEDFNRQWSVNRILETPGITKVTLFEGDDNRLRFQSSCPQQ